MASEVPDVANSVGWLLGGGAMRHIPTGRMVFHLGMLDLDAEPKRPTSVDLAFLAHGVTASPHDPRQFVLFEKHGPGCCVVELEFSSRPSGPEFSSRPSGPEFSSRPSGPEFAAGTGAVVQTIEAGKGRQFYGHGVFSADGALLFCTETDVEDQSRGYIAVRDARDFALLGDFPSFGRAPHDCMLTEDGRTLVVSNGGSPVGESHDPPNIAWVDVADQSLRERVDVPDPVINAGHLAMTSDGEIALVSAPRDGLDPLTHRGGVSLLANCPPGLKGRSLKTMHEPREVTEALVGETLSVAIHEPTGVVGATTPLGNYVTFWRMQTGELVGKLRVPNPRGIALSVGGDEFIVNFGEPPRAARVDATTLRPVDAPGNVRGHPSLVTGSHIAIVAR